MPYADIPPHHWLALTHFPQIGGATLRRLLDRFGSIAEVVNAPLDQLQQSSCLDEATCVQLTQLRLEDYRAELVRWQAQQISLLTWADPAYPHRLLAINSAPPVLFVRGQFPADFPRTVAIVGSRQVSERARRTAHRLAEQLTAHGYTIVSGLALGIDIVAHRGSLAVPKGRTFAVLGSGVNQIYPPQNRALAQQIITQHGAILSEQRPTMPPNPQQLMIRNRIIAGLSQAVIVVEASATSGALPTARIAHKLQRPVFAYPNSPGTDTLLRQFAQRLMWDDPATLNQILTRLHQYPPPSAVQLQLLEEQACYEF